MGTVVPSSNSMSLLRGRMASMCLSQKSQPRITSVPKRSTTLNLTISNRDPTCTARLIVPSIATRLLLASLTLYSTSKGCINFCISAGINALRIKLEPAPVSTTTTNRPVDFLESPMYAAIL